MKFKKSLLSFLFLTTTAFAAHTSSRKVFATDITNKSGTSVFYFPTSLPLASRACVMNADREITSSSVTDTELGYLSGVTSAIQTQLDAKYGGLPSQTGNSGKYLTTNGTSESWATVSAGISALTTDVTASGSGSVAATVVQVGGYSAANVAAGATLANAATAANTASALVARDSSKNFLVNNIGTTTTSTTGSNNGTLTLTNASSRRQRIAGTATNYKINLPDATTLGQNGFTFLVDNRGSTDITIRDTGSNVLYTVYAGTEALLTATSTASANGTWEIQTAIGQPATDSASGYLSASDHTTYTATGTTVSNATDTNTASAIVKRTADGNVWTNGAQQRMASTATAAGTTTLTVADAPIQTWTGSTTQTIKMPAANTLKQIGTTYKFINKSSGTLTIQDNSAGAITTVAGGTSADVYVSNIGSAAGTWIADAATAGAPSLTNTYVGFGASGVLSGSADHTWDDTNKSLFINTAAASTGPRLLQLCHGTQTGTATTDCLIAGYPTANSSNFNFDFQENATITFKKQGTTFLESTTTATRLWGPSQPQGIIGTSTGWAFGNAGGASTAFEFQSALGYFPATFTSGFPITLTSASAPSILLNNTGNGTVNLGGFTSVGTNYAYTTLQKIDADNDIYTIDPNASETLYGNTTITMESQFDSITVAPNNTTTGQLSVDNRAPRVQSITTNTTLAPTHRDIIVLCDATSGNVTATGYAVAGKKGWKVTLKKTDASGNSCIYTAASGAGDGASVTITTQNAGKTITTNGTDSYIIGSF